MLSVNELIGFWAGESGAGAGAHRYWRFSINTVLGGVWASTYAFLSELEMAASPGGANLCPSAGGAYSASTEGNGPASQAFDGSTSVGYGWGSTSNASGAGSEWIRYVFPTAVAIREMRAISSYFTTNTDPNTVDIEFSDDGSTWTIWLPNITLAWVDPGSGTRTATILL